MSIFQKILQTLGLTVSNNPIVGEPPIQDFSQLQDPELKTHLNLVDKHFSFLTNELGFKLTRFRMDGHEHTTVFSKDNISVHIIFAWGALPMIYVKNNLLPYDESKRLTNTEVVQDYNDEIRTIMNRHSERLKPVYEKFYKNNYDRKYFQEDFENFGREDYVKYMTLSENTTKDIIINQKGKIKNAL